jgi:regulator of protease activity HflC (stomatin/prohibitin superfamily)
METQDFANDIPSSAPEGFSGRLKPIRRHCRRILVCAVLAALAYAAATHPPIETVERGDAGLRVNQWTGEASVFPPGPVLVIPGIHELRAFALRERAYHPKYSEFRSADGLLLGVDFTVLYTVDAEKIRTLGRLLPEDIDSETAIPLIQDVLHQVLSRHAVREIFSDRSQEIQTRIDKELQARLEAEGLALKRLTLREIKLPDELQDRIYHPKVGDFQSADGLALGVDFTVRYAIGADRISGIVRRLPKDVDGEIVSPITQDMLHKTLSLYTVREIFSEKRQEIQTRISKELQARLEAEGLDLKLLTIGKINLPRDYLAGMEKMLATELASEQMKFTLELKEKEVKESELRAEAKKVQRETEARAAAQEQVIAAQAQAEAMKHILPFKEKQIRQRELEAEAEKAARIGNAHAAAEARRIEAQAEADSRRKLADAEAYRLDQVGKVNSEQMAREGAILARSPLLIQKTMAEKLSDKVQVIIASPGANGRFLGENLIGRLPESANAANAAGYAEEEED